MLEIGMKKLFNANVSSYLRLCTPTKADDDADYMQELCRTLALDFTRRWLTTFATSSALEWSALRSLRLGGYFEQPVAIAGLSYSISWS